MVFRHYRPAHDDTYQFPLAVLLQRARELGEARRDKAISQEHHNAELEKICADARRRKENA